MDGGHSEAAGGVGLGPAGAAEVLAGRLDFRGAIGFVAIQAAAEGGFEILEGWAHGWFRERLCRGQEGLRCGQEESD
jgi:hypothetical protein